MHLKPREHYESWNWTDQILNGKPPRRRISPAGHVIRAIDAYRDFKLRLKGIKDALSANSLG